MSEHDCLLVASPYLDTLWKTGYPLCLLRESRMMIRWIELVWAAYLGKKVSFGKPVIFWECVHNTFYFFDVLEERKRELFIASESTTIIIIYHSAIFEGLLPGP